MEFPIIREQVLLKDQMEKKGSIFFYSEEMARFDFGPDHPYKPERAANAYELCNRYGVMNHPWMSVLEPEPIDASLLTLFHTSEYLKQLREASKGNMSLEIFKKGIGTADTPLILGIYDWAVRAAGGTRKGINSLINDEVLTAFNPFGGFHHAMPDNSEGFCYLNDIAISIIDAISISPGLRIAYIDLDAHHGNGVQHAFYNNPEVLVVSLHEAGETLYPWSGFEGEIGEGKGLGYTVNIPLEPGTDDDVYDFIFENAALPIIESFGPDLIVAELGADALVSDPLTHLKLTNNSYQKAIKGIIKICPKILGLGGGGYDIFRTSRCWTLAWSLLNGIEPVDEFAGLVGGMMFGPEMEMGSLYDHPYKSPEGIRKKAFKRANHVLDFIKANIFPIHGLK